MPQVGTALLRTARTPTPHTPHPPTPPHPHPTHTRPHHTPHHTPTTYPAHYYHFSFSHFHFPCLYFPVLCAFLSIRMGLNSVPAQSQIQFLFLCVRGTWIRTTDSRQRVFSTRDALLLVASAHLLRRNPISKAYNEDARVTRVSLRHALPNAYGSNARTARRNTRFISYCSVRDIVGGVP